MPYIIVGASIARPAHKCYEFALTFGEFCSACCTDGQWPPLLAPSVLLPQMIVYRRNIPPYRILLVEATKHNNQILCVLHRKTFVRQWFYTILQLDENLLEKIHVFMYNVRIAVPRTLTGYSGRPTPFPKGVFDHYVYC